MLYLELCGWKNVFFKYKGVMEKLFVFYKYFDLLDGLGFDIKFYFETF